MRNLFRSLKLFGAMTALLSMFVVASSAAAAVTVTKISPATGPEYSGIAVKIKGTGFSTTPGATTIAFGGEAAKDVVCSTSKSCTAVTPYVAEGTANVTATVAAVTSTNTVPFAFSKFSPPVVDIVAGKKGPRFSKSKIKDSYPAIFTYGNLYLEITNSTTETQTFKFESRTETLEAGLTFGINFPIDEATPKVFELTTANAKKTLTVTSKTPK